MSNILKLIFFLLFTPVALAGTLAGEVRSVVGVAYLISSDGERHAVTEGMPLHAGDILQTGVGAHLHLHMVDDALLSLRPDSEIKISDYAYQPGVPEHTRIRFDLLRGTVRSVTGKGGQQAKDKFRMNTPVAAIGVRGTDFVAQADAMATRVSVQSGAIVLAPLGGACQAATFGPCQGSAARVLTADMRNMMLELTSKMSVPQLVPLIERSMIIPSLDQSNSEGQAKPLPVPAAPETAMTVQQRGLASLIGGQPVAAPVAVTVAPVVPAVPITVAPVVPITYQMAWGVWMGGVAGSDINSPYLLAAQGREAIVGGGAGGILYRDKIGPNLMPVTGRADFILRQSQVSMLQAGMPVAGTVQSGSLGVDFVTASYTTQLSLLHPAITGSALLSVSGGLRDDGLLMPSSSPTGFVAGTLSRDTREAGYLFSLPTAAGALNGTTLWAR